MIWTPRQIPIRVQLPEQQPSRAWRQLQQQQHEFFIPGCICCWPSVIPCELCDYLGEYEIVVDHLADQFCSDCELWNGTFTLTNATLTTSDSGYSHEDAPCTWWSPHFGSNPCLSSGHWMLSLVPNASGPGISAALYAGVNNWVAKWGTSNFNCEGESELTWQGFGNGFQCTGSMDPIFVNSI